MTIAKSDNNQSETPILEVPTQPPVFIFGMMQRCGSNFLSDVLLSYPRYQLPAMLDEDYVMEHAHLLLQYADKTYSRWKGLPWINTPEDCRRILLRSIGNGILELLKGQIAKDKCLLAKTPAAYNIDKVFHLFPDAKLLILIRDGRDAVESAARKWPTESYEFWIKRWVEGARLVLNFMRDFGDLRGKSWKLVKYEDLLERPEAVTADLLSFLELDPADFDWNRMRRLPVHGSSQYRDESGKVIEKALERSSDFNPLGRWRHWGWSRKRMFKKIAGKELIGLGYVSNNDW
jgi:sulfotransferase family protein